MLELLMISFILHFHIQTADCIWGSWSDWSTCSQSCEGGIQLRTRRLVAPERNGGECNGESIEQQDCNTEICPAGIDIKCQNILRMGNIKTLRNEMLLRFTYFHYSYVQLQHSWKRNRLSK